MRHTCPGLQRLALSNCPAATAATARACPPAPAATVCCPHRCACPLYQCQSHGHAPEVPGPLQPQSLAGLQLQPCDLAGQEQLQPQSLAGLQLQPCDLAGPEQQQPCDLAGLQACWPQCDMVVLD